MLENIRETKLQKIKNLAEADIVIFPEKSRKDFSNKEVIDNFDKLQGQEEICLAGRIRSIRLMGSLAFVHIEDESGKIQVLLKKEDEKSYRLFVENIDAGDFLQFCGKLFTTRAGEKTLEARSWKILSKSLLPIPTEFYGLKDKEELLRKRYLDILVDPATKELFRKKSVFWNKIRGILKEKGFLEVDTPAFESIPGGADARPFITHHNALDRDFYLRISLELPLKRLLVGGYEKVFEIGRVFRNEGIDAEHLQDYLAMEFYLAYSDMEKGMRLVEQMYKDVVFAVMDGYETEYDGNKINWNEKWPVADYFEIFKKETGIDLSKDVSTEDLKAKAIELGIKYEAEYDKGRMIDAIYKKTVRPKLIQPAFLTGHPIEVSPLAKKDPQNPKKVLRFQVLAGGSELGNGFSELNDPIDQRKRFEEQMKLREKGDEEAQMLDEDYIEAMEYGMPPAVGFGLSERLFSFITNRPIRETTIFPLMREK